MLDRLNDVQTRDLKLDSLRGEMDEVPSDLVAVRQQKSELEEHLLQKRKEREGLRRKVSQNELELATLEQRRRLTSEDALRASSPKEASQYQNRELQIAAELEELEEDTLPLMESLDRVSAEVGDLEEELTELEPNLQALTEQEEARIEMIGQRLASVRAERESLAAAIEAKLLKQYEQVRRARRGIGLVEILSGQTCGGCNMRLPIHVVQKARSGKVVTRCPSCGRILWHRD
ncbi:MAG: C4-type zinc ribbon domain-containing protein [Truepera sp.]|nr:C4-type zinc ribbon domain-containing protein [Truepera sp.]